MYVTTPNIACSASKSYGMINNVNKSHVQGISDTLLRFNFNINITFYYNIHIFLSNLSYYHKYTKNIYLNTVMPYLMLDMSHEVITLSETLNRVHFNTERIRVLGSKGANL